MIFDRKGISSFATATIAVVIGAAIFASVAVWYVAAHKSSTPPPSGPVACTAEAKLCPDGSYVARTGPNCEFAACPMAIASSTPTSTPTSTINAANWKTYTNQQYGFDFKYPSDWMIISLAHPEIGDVLVSLASPSTTQGAIDNPNSDYPTKDGFIFVESNPKNLAVKEYYNASSEINYFAPNIPLLLETSTVIGGVSAEHIILVGGLNNYDVIIIPRKSFFLRIETEVNSPVFQRIISSMHFLRGAGAFCGGIATGAFPCDPGYSCKLDGTYPDSGGHCLKE